MASFVIGFVGLFLSLIAIFFTLGLPKKLKSKKVILSSVIAFTLSLILFFIINSFKTMEKIKSWQFGDTKKEADYLLNLVLTRKKKATSSLYDSYINKKQSLPKIGDKNIIKDSRNIPIVKDTNNSPRSI